MTQFGTLPSDVTTVQIDEVNGLASIQLSPDEQQELRHLANSDRLLHKSGDHSVVSRLRQEAYKSCLTELLAVCEAIRNGSFFPTALIIRGLATDVVHCVPLDSECVSECKNGSLSESQLLTLGSLLGEPYGIDGEGDELVNNIIPSIDALGSLTGTGSMLKLGFHTENAVHRWWERDRDLSPTGVLLIGVATPSNGPTTYIANGRIAAAHMNDGERAVLRQECVRLALPQRQRRGGKVERAAPSPVLSGRPGYETVTAAFYGDMMEPISDNAIRALKNFHEELEACAVRVRIEPGVLVYIPNIYSLHGRDSFVSQFDEYGRAQRWLQRIFITGRLDAFQFRASRSERIFALK